MEENFRNVLIILSAIVITAIFIHGLWIIRKQKNPYKLKTSKDKSDPITRDFDGNGFDQDGVGQVKVKPSSQESQSSLDDAAVAEHILRTGIELPDDLSKSQILIKNDVLSDITKHRAKLDIEQHDNSAEPVLDSTLETNWFNDKHSSQGALGDELTATAKKRAYIEPLYEQPVTQHKPAQTPSSKVSSVPEKAVANSTSVTSEPTGTDFDKSNSTQVVAAEKNTSKPEPDVVALSVVMPANQQMLGAALLPSLLTLGLKYGDMNIFHRHEDSAGNGKVTFSLANIMNPGSFDLDTMETFATRGVTLFMTLPNEGEPLVVFDNMLNAAKQLAQEFNAQILDDKRNIMTKQTEQHYLSKIREFDRKSRIALAN
ncbi:cell division protein ZipA [Colwellia ponticola]|uniref:Cell division protein ZipA n=1 Tax=Colwellia ponticola TaxID=2304625 RepID=A0A8H2JJW3_9GAMM|nr:cell division protein ZipA [Colwellia ponticola]TMM42610.1 cell division protein ZipA [Colwellia ponticola]